MGEIVILKLPRNFVGQLLDCLEVNIEDWNRTKIYLEDGDIDPNEPYVRECNDVDEAERLENYYIGIKTQIENQLKEQS
jgi:hypothetical protein